MSGTMNDSNLPLPPQFMTPDQAAASPVVTDGIAATTPQSNYFSALERLMQMRQPQQTGMFDMSPDQERSLDRLAAFGAALASTRSPTFGGALGEGIQALLRTGAGQRQEARQERQVDLEGAYRAAQEARQAAELEWARDPENPINQLRMSQASAAEMEARARLLSAARSGAERLGPGMTIRDREGNIRVFYPQAGRSVEVPGTPLTFETANRRATAQDIAAIERAANDEIRSRTAAGEILSQADQTRLRQSLMLDAARRRQIDPETIPGLQSAPTSNVEVRERRF